MVFCETKRTEAAVLLGGEGASSRNVALRPNPHARGAGSPIVRYQPVSLSTAWLKIDSTENSSGEVLDTSERETCGDRCTSLCGGNSCTIYRS